MSDDDAYDADGECVCVCVLTTHDHHQQQHRVYSYCSVDTLDSYDKAQNTHTHADQAANSPD